MVGGLILTVGILGVDNPELHLSISQILLGKALFIIAGVIIIIFGRGLWEILKRMLPQNIG